MDSIENSSHIVENSAISNEESKRNRMIEYLLKMEAQNKPPPKCGFMRSRGLFDIPFKTETYKVWWTTGDEILKKIAFDAINARYSNKFYNMYLEEYFSLPTVVSDERMGYLLYRESENKPPPKSMYNEDRGFFDIPFQTEEYRKWWSNGPTPSEDVEDATGEYPDLYAYRLQLSNSKTEEQLKERDSMYGKERTNLKVKYHLLYRESQKKKPPKWRCNQFRGKHEIPFETKEYKEWWASGPRSSDDASNSECLDDSDENLNPSKHDKYDQKYTIRYLLSREASNAIPSHGLNILHYEHGSFEIPFQTLRYRRWWNTPSYAIRGPSIGYNQKSYITKMLLGYESLNMDPPRKDYRFGVTLDIPFKTKTYIDWWKGEYVTSTVEHHFSNVYCALIVDCFSEIDMNECDYRHWLTKYLLDLEEQNKSLPNFTFSGERGRFPIPFQTERFKTWWAEFMDE